MVDNGQSWLTLFNSGQSWLTLVDNGQDMVRDPTAIANSKLTTVSHEQ